MELIPPPTSDPLVASHEDEQGAVELEPRTYMSGLQPEVWAGLFQASLEILEPLLSWMNQVLYEACGR